MAEEERAAAAEGETPQDATGGLAPHTRLRARRERTPLAMEDDISVLDVLNVGTISIRALP